MRSDTRNSAVDSPAPAEFRTRSPPRERSATQAAPNTARAREAVGGINGIETSTERFRRKALRGRLHGYAIAVVVLVAVLVALAASNTARVKVNWLFGSSHVSLVWLVLVTAILGWVLGLMASARFHWRTRAPRRQAGRGHGQAAGHPRVQRDEFRPRRSIGAARLRSQG